MTIKLSKRKKFFAIVVGLLLITILIFNYISSIPKSTPDLVSPETKIGEDISFTSFDDTKLVGNFIKAKGNNSPVVVMVTGSGTTSYKTDFNSKYKVNFWQSIANVFLKNGVSVLFVEKRNTNGSEGDWRLNTLTNRAEDVYSAIKYLKTRNDINKNSIGICGHSQGGWVSQIAAGKHPKEVSFLVNLSGAVTTVKEQEIDNTIQMEVCAGIDKEELSSFESKLRFKLGSFAIFSRVIKTNHFSRIINEYNPLNVLPKIKAPFFALYAENDHLVPPEKNIKILKGEFDKAQKTNYSYSVISGATHGYWKVSDPCDTYKVEDYTITQECTQVLDNWIKKNITMDKRNWKIDGIGGIFIYSEQPKQLANWYSHNLGLETKDTGSETAFCINLLSKSFNDIEIKNKTVWSSISTKHQPFPNNKSFMVNYRVHNIENLVSHLNKNNIEILKDGNYENGRFVWINDPEGNTVELWEYNDSDVYKSFDSTSETIFGVSDVIIYSNDYLKLTKWYNDILGIKANINVNNHQSQYSFEGLNYNNTDIKQDIIWSITNKEKDTLNTMGFIYGYWVNHNVFKKTSSIIETMSNDKSIKYLKDLDNNILTIKYINK